MRRQRGFSLLEFSLVLAVVLVIGGVVAGAAAHYARSAKAGDLRTHLVAVKAGAKAMSKQGGVPGLQNHGAIARAGGVPTGQLVPAAAVGINATPGRADALAAAGSTVLRHPFGGVTSVRLPGVDGAGGITLATIELFDLSTEQCIQAVVIGWDSFDRVSVNGAPAFKDRFAAPARTLLDAAAVDLECSSRAINVVRYEFAP